MSNHEPDFNRSARRHRGPLLGLVVIGVFITLMTTAYLLWWGVGENEVQSQETPMERIDGEVSGTRPVEGQSLSRDPTPGPVGVAPDAGETESRDTVD